MATNTAKLAGLLLCLLSLSPAHAGMPMPLSLDHYKNASDAPAMCGLRADFDLAGSPMRVEFETLREAEKIRLTMRAFAPNTMNTPIRDIWLHTNTLFSLGVFKPGYMNSNGITEASGMVDIGTGKSVLEDVVKRGPVFSIVVDGFLPTSRMAVGLPKPLPTDVGRAFEVCVLGTMQLSDG